MPLKMSALAGKTAGIVTPSSPAFPGRVAAMVDFFQSSGVNVKLGLHHDKRDRFLAGTDQQRASDLMRHFLDPEVDFLVVTGGGAGSLRLLPLLDLEVIARHKKPIIGFSDTTSVQLGLYAKTGLISYTGFTGRDVHEFEIIDPIIEQTFVACVLEQNHTIIGATPLIKGTAQGPLVGGNMSCLTALMGTPYQPPFEGHILVLEDVRAEPYVIDTMLTQLYLAGVFDVVAGVVFGQFYGCEPQYHPDRDGSISDVIADWVAKLKVPAVSDFRYGHVNSRSMWPIGVAALLDAANGSLMFSF